MWSKNTVNNFITNKVIISFKVLSLATDTLVPTLNPWLEAFLEDFFRKGFQLWGRGHLNVGDDVKMFFFYFLWRARNPTVLNLASKLDVDWQEQFFRQKLANQKQLVAQHVVMNKEANGQFVWSLSSHIVSRTF